MSALEIEPLRDDRREHPVRTAGVEALVVTVDEVRALARLRGSTLPAALADDDEPEPRVDAAALRGLAARGLAAVAGSASDRSVDEVVPAPALRALLVLLNDAVTLVEVDVDAGGVDRRAVAAGGPAGTVALVEGPTGLWRVVDGDDLGDMIAALADAVLTGSDPEGPHPAGGGFSCPAGAHAAADDRLAAGDAGGAVALLLGAGVAPDAAQAWATAVTGRRAAVAVHAAHTQGPGRWRLDELRVVVGPDGRRWRLDLVDGRTVDAGEQWADHDDDRPGRPDDVLADLRSVATCVDADAVRAALAELCGEATP